MGSLSKASALLLTLIITSSCLTLVIAKPVNAQSGETPNYPDYIPTPDVPQFTLRFIQSSYDEVVIDPYTGAQTTRRIDNSTFEITIKNQPFTAYDYGWECKGKVYNSSTALWYNVQAKGHYSNDWAEVYINNTVTTGSSAINTQSSSSDYTAIFLLQSDTDFPAGGEVDFRVRAMAGGWFPPVLNSQINLPMKFISKNSTWSEALTVALADGSPSSSNSPNPTVFPSPTSTSPDAAPNNSSNSQQVINLALIAAVAVLAVAVVSLLVYVRRIKNRLPKQ